MQGVKNSGKSESPTVTVGIEPIVVVSETIGDTLAERQPTS